jgi:hypothetical protein
MIFTIGHTENYLRAFQEAADEGTKLKKIGRREKIEGTFYSGGSVWQTRDDAQMFLDERGMSEYSVWGVLADWDIETVPNVEKAYHDLLVDSELVMLEDNLQ